MQIGIETLHLLRKDLTRFRWMIGAVLVLTCAQTWLNCEMPAHHGEILNSPLQTASLLLGILPFCLIALAVFEERLVGERQYWLTRPMSWKALLLEKLLFGIVTLGIPSLLGQAVALAVNGYSPLTYVPGLLWNQVLLFPCLVAVVAVATVLSNFTTFILTGIVAVITSLFWMDRLETIASENMEWGGFGWARIVAYNGAALLLGGMVVVWQYRRRSTIPGRIFLACGTVSFLMSPLLGGWHAAFDMTAAISPRPEAGHTIHVNFEPEGETPPCISSLAGDRVPTATRIALPVKIIGIARATEFLSERVAFSIVAPEGEKWRSGWLYTNQVAPVTDWQNNYEWITRDGSYWLSADIPTPVYNRLANVDARVDAQMTFTVTSAPRIIQLPPDFNGRRIPGVGICSINMISGRPLFGCVLPFQQFDIWDFNLQNAAGATERTPGCCMVSYGPVPTDGTLWADVGPLFRHGSYAAGDRVSIEIRRPLCHIERSVQIPHIHLAEYFVDRHDARL